MNNPSINNIQTLDRSMPISTLYIQKHGVLLDFMSNYTIVSELGTGGFGFVVSAIQHCKDREVAVKFIFKRKVPSYNWARDKDLGIVPLEVFLLKNLRHESIVSFIDYMEDDTFCYLIMELHGQQFNRSKSQIMDFIDFKMKNCHLIKQKSVPVMSHVKKRPSTDLFECIEKNNSFEESRAKHIFKQLVDCIQYLHSRGVIHRDIKDENIVIDQDFKVKLIDFGSAGLESRTALFERFQGTVQYASPEVLLGKKYRGRPLDVWAMGILLYTLLFGQVPFNSASQVLKGDYNDPPKQISVDCMHLMDWMLAKKPSERPNIEQVASHKWLQQ